MNTVMNKSMDRDDLFAEVARPTVDRINQLIRDLYANGCVMTSWYGSIDKPNTPVGLDNRGANYEKLPDAVDDNRIPWFLYWEIEWVMRNGPKLRRGMRVLDAGGTSSLFSFYMASLGVEVHSIDINPSLIKNAQRVSRRMGWNIHSYAMDIQKLEFEEGFFDAAYSICVFEHLDFYIKQHAFVEIHRCLKPGGQLCLTFDYANPAPWVFAYNNFDPRPRNSLSDPRRVEEVLLMPNLFSFAGNQEFADNGKRYLDIPDAAEGIQSSDGYSFGAVFLEKKNLF